jgi:hypothetical protein
VENWLIEQLKVSSPSLALLLVISLALWKIALPKLLDKELARFKNDLNLQRDKIKSELEAERDMLRHELQKSFLVAELGTKNLHSLYPRVFEKMEQLNILMMTFYGELAKDFTQLSDDELLDLFVKTHRFGTAKAQSMIQELKDDPDAANRKIAKVIFDKELFHSLFKIKNEEQFLREKALFISEPVRNQLFGITEKLRSKWKALKLAYTEGLSTAGNGFEKALQLDEDLKTDFSKLENLMRRELGG